MHPGLLKALWQEDNVRANPIWSKLTREVPSAESVSPSIHTLNPAAVTMPQATMSYTQVRRESELLCGREGKWAKASGGLRSMWRSTERDDIKHQRLVTLVSDFFPFTCNTTVFWQPPQDLQGSGTVAKRLIPRLRLSNISMPSLPGLANQTQSFAFSYSFISFRQTPASRASELLADFRGFK